MVISLVMRRSGAERQGGKRGGKTSKDPRRELEWNVMSVLYVQSKRRVGNVYVEPRRCLPQSSSIVYVGMSVLESNFLLSCGCSCFLSPILSSLSISAIDFRNNISSYRLKSEHERSNDKETQRSAFIGQNSPTKTVRDQNVINK